MLLSDEEISYQVHEGVIGIDPFDESMIQPASIDMRLDSVFLTFNEYVIRETIDPAKPVDRLMVEHRVPVGPGSHYRLDPGAFALATTFERVRLPAHFAGRFEGKSSLGRLGLLTHSTAGFIDPGFEGHITLELVNNCPHPIKLWPGMKIGQLCFIWLSSPAINPYGSNAAGSHYQGQRGPTASRSHVNFKSWSHQ